MSIGIKIKQCRKKAGLSQEELAGKLCVSRQAITKWENNKGIPDISNLQCIAKLFDVSVDYLIEENTIVLDTVVREVINLEEYKKIENCRSKFDAVVKDQYPKAEIIYPLIRKKKLSLIENVIDFIVQPGVLNVADSLNNSSSYYFVKLENKQLLVNVTKEFIESREVNCQFAEKKQIVGNQIFMKSSYTL